MRPVLLALPLLAACPKRPVAPLGDPTPSAAPAEAPVLPGDPPWRAVVVSQGMLGDLVLTCADTSGMECEVPACGEEGCPEVAVLVVGMADLVEGPVSIPISRGAVAWDRSEPGCENLVTTAGGDEPRAWEPGRAIVPMPAATVADAVPEGLSVASVLAVDLDGDGTDEWIVTGEAETGAVAGVVRDGAWVPVVEEVRADVPEDATEQERWDAQVRAFTGEILGLTDVGLDGSLELVVHGDGYESVSYAVGPVGPVEWTPVGRAGCAH